MPRLNPVGQVDAADRRPPRIVIRGWGLVSPLGFSAWETFSALLAGRTIADRASRLPPDIGPVDLVRTLGCVSVAQHVASDPAIELAERAAREAIFMAEPGEGCSPTQGASVFPLLQGGRLGGGPIDGEHSQSPSPVLPQAGGAREAHAALLEGYLGVSKGAIQAMAEALELVPGRKRTAPQARSERALAVALGPHAYLAHHLGVRLGLGSLRCIVAACASSLTALHEARLALLRGDNNLRRLLVVTSEAALLPPFIHTYERLGVLPPLTVGSGNYVGRPLDRARGGFMLAELGAAVVLERLEPDQPWPPGQIELLDTAIAAEAYDVIRPAPRMDALTRVAERLFAKHPVDVVHPHATGTSEHDETELKAYRPTELSSTSQFYACKGALGHGLGASGLVSLVIACLCAKTARRPPMPWLEHPIDSRFALSAGPQRLPRRSIHAVFAAGFGGHVAGAVVGC